MSVKELFDLRGNVALVTGGSRGLGFQIAEGLGEMGAKIAITARKPDELDAACSRLSAKGIEVFAVTADLANLDQVPGVVDEVIRKYGAVDVLVNCAGTSWGAKAEDHPIEVWQNVFNLNVTSLFRLTQEVANRSMIKSGRGRVLNIASIAGLFGNPHRIMRSAAYNASKGAVVNLTRALAAEWGQHGITVNAICPGYFHSKMANALIERNWDAIIQNTPLARVGGEEDLKGLAVLLASNASRHITGQCIAVDGGASAI